MKSELFVIRDEVSPILYAPLKELSARINESAVRSIFRKINNETLEPEDEEIINTLELFGFFKEDQLPLHKKIPPTEVTLFPSDGCNLRCKYCYASAEKIRHIMPIEIGKAAVDYIVQNALNNNQKQISVGFHGNGEPFTAFDFMKEICSYAKEKADNNGISVKLFSASNGCWTDEMSDWVMAWLDSVNISFDGTEELQNRQRPFANNMPSFPAVDKTLKRLNDSGKSFGIRTTLTSESVGNLAEIAAFVMEHYPNCEKLHVEPVWESGRSLQSETHTPDAKIFIEQFIKSKKLFDNDKRKLVFSAARNKYKSIYFCGVSRDSFVVTSEGLVTSCYEVCETCDERAETFIYGKYDNKSNCFVFDERKTELLHRMNVTNIPYCKDCFCKYHCAGDCPAKLIGCNSPEDHCGSIRCEITRALTLNQITEDLID